MARRTKRGIKRFLAWIFHKQPTMKKARRIQALDSRTRQSFSRVKSDILDVERRIAELKDRHIGAQQIIEKQNAWLQRLLKQANDVQNRIQGHNDYLLQHSSTLDDHRDKLAKHTGHISDHELQLQTIKQKLTDLQAALERVTLPASRQEVSPAERGRRTTKLLTTANQKILQNLKMLVKNDIYKLVEGSGILTVAQLRQAIVIEKELCSRASFFRYLQEMRQAGRLETKTLEGQKVVQLGKAKTKAPYDDREAQEPDSV